MPLDPTIYGDIGKPVQSVNRLAQIFDPTVIQARQLEDAQTQDKLAQIQRTNRLREMLTGAQTADPAALSQRLAQNGFADEAMKYQALADAKQQRQAQEMQRRAGLLASANGQIGASGGSDDAIREHYAAIGLPADRIQAKIDWLNANVKPEERQQHFLDAAFPERITKREEAKAKAIEAGEQKAADRQAREEAIAAQDRRTQMQIEAQDRRSAAQNATTLAAIDRKERAAQVREEAKANKPGNATEGERKAATLLARLEGSRAQLEQALQEDPGAAKPNIRASIAGKLPLIGETAQNVMTPQARQRVEAAQLDMLDAALTLGTGAAYTKEQLKGYAKSYFPQIGDDAKNVADKKARLDNVLGAARIAAGRAASQVPPAQQQAPAKTTGGGFKYLGKE